MTAKMLMEKATARRKLDQYFTPAHATRELLKHIRLSGNVFECCVGDGGIYNELTGWDMLWSNDLDPNLKADFHNDVTQDWSFVFERCDWVVSNPPFNVASRILPLAFNYCRIGMAMLLRLSYLEPCLDRDKWLARHPLTKLIVLPRISFTGDGKTDNVTCAWMVWDKTAAQQEIVVVPRSYEYSTTIFRGEEGKQ